MSPQGITEGPRSSPITRKDRVPAARPSIAAPLDIFEPPRRACKRALPAMRVPRSPSPTRAAAKSHGWVDALRRAWPHNTLTPLQNAIVDNDVAQVRTLLAEGADVEARDSMGHTALHVAAALNSEKFVELLLEHGATVEANDHMGLTPLYCAAQFKAFGTLELLLDEARALMPTPSAWYSVERLGAMCGGLRQCHRDLQALDASAVDALLAQLVGIGAPKLEQLNKLEPLLVYHAHLLSLTGDQFDLDLEGWNDIDMLLQRTRTLLRCAAIPEPLPENAVPAAVGSALVYELRCNLEQIRLVHRLMVLEHLPAGPRRMELLEQEARHLSWAVQHWPLGEEVSIPTGFPEHRCYVCFSRRVIDNKHVITVRLDNLGSTQRAAQFIDDDGRVSPLSFNIPEWFLNKEVGEAALTHAIERTLRSRTDGGTDNHALNSGIYTLLRHVKRECPDPVIEQTPFSHPEFHHKAQTVGNCVLKNHSAGACARMGRTFFKWFKRREVADVESRLSGLMAPGVLRACEGDKWAHQWAKLLDKDHLDISDVREFLDKPGREFSLWGMDAKMWQDVLRRDDAALFALLLERGARLPEIEPRRSTPLHWAVEANAPEMVMAMLRADAPIDAVDERGRTALHLAVKDHHTHLVNMLLSWGADATVADEEGETAEGLVRHRAQQAKQMQRNFSRAAARRRGGSEHEQPAQPRALRHVRINLPRKSGLPAPD